MNTPVIASSARVARGGSPRTILTTAAVFAAAILLALVGAGTSYAAWSGTASVDASSVASGSTSITINGGTDVALDDLNLRKIGPGQSVITGQPVIMVNTGTTPVSASVTSTTIVSQLNALADHLTITLLRSADRSCTSFHSGELTGSMATFATTASPFLLPAGASVHLCIRVTMNAGAPATAQNGAVIFAMNVDAVQVR